MSSVIERASTSESESKRKSMYEYVSVCNTSTVLDDTGWSALPVLSRLNKTLTNTLNYKHEKKNAPCVKKTRLMELNTEER